MDRRFRLSGVLRHLTVLAVKVSPKAAERQAAEAAAKAQRTRRSIAAARMTSHGRPQDRGRKEERMSRDGESRSFRRKFCKLCFEGGRIDYKMTGGCAASSPSRQDRPRRISGAMRPAPGAITEAVKRARIRLLPFAVSNTAEAGGASLTSAVRGLGVALGSGLIARTATCRRRCRGRTGSFGQDLWLARRVGLLLGTLAATPLGAVYAAGLQAVTPPLRRRARGARSDRARVRGAAHARASSALALAAAQFS
jgi:ribosomal protein S18